jgi:L-ribulose-5-phosphate 3-epimerase
MGSRVRIGVTQWSLDGSGADTVYKADELGFSAMHIDSGDLDGDLRLDDDAVRDRYRRAAGETGVAIAAIAGGGLNDLGLTSPPRSANADNCRASIRIAIDAAVDLGVPVVFLPSFRAGEIRDEADLRRTAEVLAEACDYAADRPITIATENTLGAEANLRLLAIAARPGLRILLDTQNPYLWGHPVAPMVDALWPHLVDQVHVKDGRDGVMGDAALGEGESDFAATAGALRRHSFAGTVISENDYHGDRSSLAARDIATVAAAFGT